MTRDKLKSYINQEYVQKGLGIVDADDSELQLIVDRPRVASYYFANMISRRAQIGWSTHGHSAVDVNIYGTIGSHDLRGNNENTDVGKFLRDYLDVDVHKVTEELATSSKAFIESVGAGVPYTGKIPTEEGLRSVLRHHEDLYGKEPMKEDMH